MKTKFEAFKAAALGTLLVEGIIYILPGPRDPGLPGRMVVSSVLLFLFLYLISRPGKKLPPKLHMGESRGEYLYRIRQKLEEIGLTLEDIGIHPFLSPRQIRFEKFIGKLDDWLEKTAEKIRKPLFILIGAGCGWYAIENQSWFAGLFSLMFFYEAVKLIAKKPS